MSADQEADGIPNSCPGAVIAPALTLPAAIAVANAGLLVSREHDEPQHPYRSPFQRDRARIIHSRAFRRLAGKTQVFTDRFSDHFRSRLTHTMEVAQIARTIASALGLNEDLAESLALVHDIGHPPFGHSGEYALNDALASHGLKFDHNLHALRIVEYFEQRYAAFRGLNLTLAVREGIVKHSRDYPATEHPELGAYFLDLRPPLEAQLIDVADEIAYTTADFDDGLESGILSLEDIREHVPLLEQFYVPMERVHGGVPAKLVFNEALKRMLNAMVSDLIAETHRRIQSARLVDLEGVRRSPDRLVVFSPPMEALRLQAKRYLHGQLYDSGELAHDREQAGRVICDLFGAWIADPSLLPAGYETRINGEGVIRVVADYIAGMTDNFILGQHRRWLESCKVSA
ncbi:MAG TPA: dNTP triphosphohydrolase [Acidisarcina sp.]